jgi:3-oxoacyl-[acyl-carrier protein] reductase
VTGANRGIGKAIVETFLQQGAHVFACIRNSVFEKPVEWVELAQRHGGSIHTVALDLAAEDSIKAAVREIQQAASRIDVLVNNAGIATGGLFQMTSIAEMRKVFEVNLFSPLLFTQFIARAMARHKSGSIVNLSSTAALLPDPGTLVYGSSKAALSRATQSLANELGSLNIRVNAIAPGVTRTDMFEQMAPAARDSLIQRSALKRAAEAQDVANAALFLASDLSSHITGQILRVDGGIA